MKHLQLFSILGALGVLVGCGTSRTFLKTPPASPNAKTYPNADAVVLRHDIKCRISSSGTTYTCDHHVQAKALNQKGTAFLRSAAVTYHSKAERVTDAQARLLRPDGWTSKAVSFRPSRAFAAGYAAKAARFGHVVPGSVLEYFYRVEGETRVLRPFFMLSRMPTEQFSMSVSVPRDVPFRHKVYGGTVIAAAALAHKSGNDPDGSNRDLHRWTGRKLPSLPLRTLGKWRSWPHVRVATGLIAMKDKKLRVKSWNDVSAYYTKLVGQADEPNDEVKAFAQGLVKGKSSEQDKVMAIASFVRDHIRTNREDAFTLLWPVAPASRTLKIRAGDSKAKATLVVAMLKAVGVKSRQVLIRTRRLGRADVNFPTHVASFDHVINFVPTLNKGTYLDTTAGGELGTLSVSLQRSSALAVGTSSNRLFLTPTKKAEDELDHRFLRMDVEKLAWNRNTRTKPVAVAGTLTVKLTGRAGESAHRKLSKSNAAKRLLWAKTKFPGKAKLFASRTLKIKNVSVKFVGKQSVAASITFTAKLNPMHWAGRQYVVPIVSITEQAKHPSIASAKAGLFLLGANQKVERGLEVTGLVPVDVPRSLKLNTKGLDYQHKYTRGKKTLRYDQTWVKRAVVLSPQEASAYAKHLVKLDATNKSVAVLHIPKPPLKLVRVFQYSNFMIQKKPFYIVRFKDSKPKFFRRQKLERTAEPILKDMVKAMKDNSRALLCITAYSKNKRKRSLLQASKKAQMLVAYLQGQQVKVTRLVATGVQLKSLENNTERFQLAKRQLLTFELVDPKKGCPKPKANK